MDRALILGLSFAACAGVASAQTSSSEARAVARPAAPPHAARAALQTVLPGTGESAFATVQGNALNDADSALSEVLVRLRDARLGRIVATQITDTAGVFQFRGLDPGSYVVELLIRETVQATSGLIAINAGETASTILKLPRRSPLGGVLGHTTSQIAAVTAAAAATGVLSAATTTDVSSDGTN